MPNSDSGQLQTLHPEQPGLIGQSHVSPASLCPDPSLHMVGWLFFFYLLIALSFGIYQTYRMSVFKRRTQALEKLFQLDAPQPAVCADGQPRKAMTPSRVYEPVPLPISQPITDTLSALDIPLGQGGFARDYVVSLSAGNQVVIELKSERFDTFVSLIAADGTTVGENDDGPDGTTNSQLVVDIPQSGTYTVRVQASSKTKAVGPFTLFVTRLHPTAGL